MAKYWTKVLIDGQTIDICDEFKMKMQEIQEQGAQYSTTDTEQKGVDGYITQSNTFAPFNLVIIYRMHTADNYSLQNHYFEMKQLLSQINPYYVWTEKGPGRRYYVDKADITYTRNAAAYATFTITWRVVRGYSESILDTQHITADIDETLLWSMGLTDVETPSYSFTGNTGRIFNAGTISIDPRKLQPLKLTLTCNGQPTIRNITNGSQMAYNKTLTTSSKLVMDGVYPMIGSKHVGRDTDHNVITLVPGWNEFQIDGASDVTMAVDFNFLYR